MRCRRCCAFAGKTISAVKPCPEEDVRRVNLRVPCRNMSVDEWSSSAHSARGMTFFSPLSSSSSSSLNRAGQVNDSRMIFCVIAWSPPPKKKKTSKTHGNLHEIFTGKIVYSCDAHAGIFIATVFFFIAKSRVWVVTVCETVTKWLKHVWTRRVWITYKTATRLEWFHSYIRKIYL